MAELANPWDDGQWPHKLTSELEYILGRPNFTLIRFAQAYRAAGFEIERRAESEQAFFIHRFVGHWFAKGDDWQASMKAELMALQSLASRAKDDAE